MVVQTTHSRTLYSPHNHKKRLRLPPELLFSVLPCPTQMEFKVIKGCFENAEARAWVTIDVNKKSRRRLILNN